MSIDTFRFCSDEFQGFGETVGLVRRDGNGLCLQWQTRDALVGLLKSELKTGHLALSEVAAIEYHSFFGLWPRVHISLSDLSAAAGLPGGAEGVIKLGVRWADRRAAANLVQRLQLELGERRFQALQQDIDQLSRVDPRRSPSPDAIRPPPAPNSAPPEDRPRASE